MKQGYIITIPVLNGINNTIDKFLFDKFKRHLWFSVDKIESFVIGELRHGSMYKVFFNYDEEKNGCCYRYPVYKYKLDI